LEYLVLAGATSFLAAATHVAIVIGGASWYRFFGAGETMASMAKQGLIRPTLITLAIALVFSVFGLFAFSGAGLIYKLPLLKIVLSGITTLYLVRGLAGFVLPWLTSHPSIAQNSLSFWMISSVICTAIGLVHLRGLMEVWPDI
jgi:putative oxidoreductase